MGDDGVCKFFLEGKCKRGHKCRFLHSTSTATASTTTTPKERRRHQTSARTPSSQPRSTTTTPAKTPTNRPLSSAKRKASVNGGGASGKATATTSSSTANTSSGAAKGTDGSSGICTYFLAGTCTRGSKCRFRHTETEGLAATPKATAKTTKKEKTKVDSRKKEAKSKRMETDDEDDSGDSTSDSSSLSSDSLSESSGGSESDTESSSEGDGSALSESSSSDEDRRKRKRALKKAAAAKKLKKQLAKEAAKRKKLKQRQREKERARASSSSSKRRKRASRRRSPSPLSSSLDSYTSSSYLTSSSSGGSESDTESEVESSDDLDVPKKHKLTRKRRDRLAKRKHRDRRLDSRRRRRRYSSSSSSSDGSSDGTSESEASVDVPPAKKAKKVAAASTHKDVKRKDKATKDKPSKDNPKEKAKASKAREPVASSNVSATRASATASNDTRKATPAEAKATPPTTPLLLHQQKQQEKQKQKEQQKQQEKLKKEQQEKLKKQKEQQEKLKKQKEQQEKLKKQKEQQEAASLPQTPSTPVSKGVTPGASPIAASMASKTVVTAQSSHAPRDYVQYLIELTRAHPRYQQTYTRMWSRPVPGGWTEPQQRRAPHGSSTRTPRILGLDCEMVETDADNNAVARVTIIAHGTTEQGEYPATPIVLLDEHIKPPGNVTDYRTKVSGVKEEHLATAASLEEVQERVLKFVRRDTVLVGHSLNFDLEALRLRHHDVIDTSLLFRVDTMGRRTFALRDVVMEVLGRDCQPQGIAHDSLQDALWPLELTRHVIDSLHNGDQGGQARSLFDPRSNVPLVHSIFVIKLPELFLTRLEVTGIPEGFTQERLTEILNGHGCNVTPELYTKFNPGNNGRGGQAKLQYPSEEAVIEAFSKLPIEFMHQTSDHSYLKQLALPSRDLLKVSVYVSKPNSVLDFQLKQAKEQRNAVAPPPPPSSQPMRAQSLFGPPRAHFPYRNAALASGPRPPMPHMHMRRPHAPPRMSAAMAASQRRHFPPTPMHGNAMAGRRPLAAGGLRRPRAPQGIAPPKPTPRDHLNSPAFF